MFAKSGLMTAPCGVPSSVSIMRPSSSTPAVSHLAISRMIRRSPIRCSTKRICHSRLTLSKKGLNVAIEHPVDPPLPDPERERIQRLMLVALRSETVAEAQELRLIDRRQNCHHRSLDNLVLYGSDAERPLSAVRLRYVLPARRQRSIRSCVDASMQV